MAELAELEMGMDAWRDQISGSTCLSTRSIPAENNHGNLAPAYNACK